jgi:hypothetical protein
MQRAKVPARIAGDRGQTTVAAMLAVLFLVLVTAGMVDLARLWETRMWSYRAAEAAALAGAGRGRDYGAYVAGGDIVLDEPSAMAEAESALLKILAVRGLESTAGYTIQAHAGPGSGSYPGYPPSAHAGMTPGEWGPEGPAVGVYLVVPVQPVLYGWVNGNREIDVHVFAAAEVLEVY